MNVGENLSTYQLGSRFNPFLDVFFRVGLLNHRTVLGSVSWELDAVCVTVHLVNLHLGNVRLGSVHLGVCTWECPLGNVHLGMCS